MTTLRLEQSVTKNRYFKMYRVECAKDIIHLQNAISQVVTFVRKMPRYIFNTFPTPILNYIHSSVGYNVNSSLR